TFLALATSVFTALRALATFLAAVFFAVVARRVAALRTRVTASLAVDTASLAVAAMPLPMPLMVSLAVSAASDRVAVTPLPLPLLMGPSWGLAACVVIGTLRCSGRRTAVEPATAGARNSARRGLQT